MISHKGLPRRPENGMMRDERKKRRTRRRASRPVGKISSEDVRKTLEMDLDDEFPVLTRPELQRLIAASKSGSHRFGGQPL